jgi:hypothetical protein
LSIYLLKFQLGAVYQIFYTPSRALTHSSCQGCPKKKSETDERLTIREAKRRLAESGLKPQNYPPIDSFAAKLILESWMSLRP